MKTKHHFLIMTPVAVITVAMLAGVPGARGADIVKANNTDRMIDGSSWVGGIAPGVNDTAIFNSTLQTSGFGTGAPLSWLGLRVTTGSSSIHISNNTTPNHVGILSGGVDMSAASRDLQIASFQQQANHTWNVAAGRTFTISDLFTQAGGSALSLAGAGTVGISGATAITLGDASTFTGSLSTGTVAMTLTAGAGQTFAINVPITTSGTLTKTGAGNYTLGANNSLGDTATAVSAGTLQVGNGGTTGNLGTGEITLGAGSTLAFNRSDSVSLGNNWASFDALGGVFTLRNEGAGLVTISDSAKNIGANFGNGITFVLDGTGRGRIDQSVASGGSDMAIRKTGTGTWTLANVANNYTGSTTITAGTLEVTGRLGAGNYAQAIANDGELHINTTSEQVISGDISGTGQLRKSSAGTLTLSGNNTYSGGTVVNAGELNVNGSIAGSAVTVNSGASLSGSGEVGAISGAGAINPGNSPGILTAPSVDPRGGMSFNFEFTSLNPTYSNATASVNDVLRLTDTTPFVALLGAVNVVNLYFNVDAFEEGQVYTGGFFTDEQAEFMAQIVDASFNYYVQDAGGAVSYGGQTYSALVEGLAIDLTTINQSADFAGGTIDGQVVQFGVVPEPSTYALLVLGAAALGTHAWRRRRRAQGV